MPGVSLLMISISENISIHATSFTALYCFLHPVILARNCLCVDFNASTSYIVGISQIKNSIGKLAVICARVNKSSQILDTPSNTVVISEFFKSCSMYENFGKLQVKIQHSQTSELLLVFLK
jgi:hypothetical protein